MEKQFLKERILAASGQSEESIEKVFDAFLKRVSEVLKQNQTIRIENIGLFQLRVEPVSRLERDASRKSKEILIYKNIKGEQSEEKNLFLTIDVEPENIQSSTFNESVFNLSIDEPSTIFDAPDSSTSDEDKNDAIKQSVDQIIAAGVILDGYELFNTEGGVVEEVDEEHELISESVKDNTKREFEDLISQHEDIVEPTEKSDVEEIAEVDEEINEDLVESEEDEKEEIEIAPESKSPFDELAELINQDKDFVREDVQDKVEDLEELESIEELEANGNKKVVILSVAAFFLIIVIATVFFTSQSDEPTTEMQSNFEEPKDIPETIEKEPTAIIDSAKADTSSKSETTKEVVLLKEKPKEKVENTPSIKVSKSTYTGLYRKMPNDVSITDRVYYDGNKYTVQISSWKSKSFAEHEVAKYKKMGHDAFVFSYYIKSKNSVWNRVRIGYFDSQQEAEAFLKKNKL